MQIHHSHDNLLKIEGRSGCSLKVFQSDGGQILVRKISALSSYNHRLLKQLEKQQKFKQFNFLDCLDSPEIISQGKTTDGLNYFDMEYITGEKFSTFLCSAKVLKIKEIIKYLINYLEENFKSSEYIFPPLDKIHSKIDELKNKLNPNQSFAQELKQKVFIILETKIPNSKIPQKTCHGDLTFSNMLFSEDGKIYLIDFLDSFVESPVIDLVKLRQDTHFFWSVEIDSNLEIYNLCKIMQILSYIDRQLQQYLLKKGADVYNWYRYLELFNLVRIMPYVSKSTEINFLKKHINSLLLSYD